MPICVGIGAAVNIIGNRIMIPMFQEYGAAFASVISELFVAGIYISLSKQYFQLEKFLKDILKCIIAAGIMGLFLVCIRYIVQNDLLCLGTQFALGIGIYFGVLWVVKQGIVMEYREKLISRIKHYKKLLDF